MLECSRVIGRLQEQNSQKQCLFKLKTSHNKVYSKTLPSIKTLTHDTVSFSNKKRTGKLFNITFLGEKPVNPAVKVSPKDRQLVKKLKLSSSPEELAMLKKGLLYRPNNDPIIPMKETLAGKFKEVTVKTEDGKELKSWFLPPKEKGGMTILFHHGNASPLGHIQDIAENIADFNDKYGVGALMLEYRGYGQNKGLPMFEENEDIYKDAEAGFNFLEKEGIPESNVVSWGISLGGAPATEIAARHQEIKGLILESTYTNNNKVFNEEGYLGFLKEGGFLTEKEVKLLQQSPDAKKVVEFLAKSESFNLRPVDKMSKTKGIPTLIIHSGKNDTIIPQAMAEEIYDSSPNKKGKITPKILKETAVTELHISKEGNHRFLAESSKARIKNFIKSLLQSSQN